MLSHIAISSYKFGNDLRLLQHDKELEEPFENNQIGSSAMAYKRNPMRSERICSLSRHAITLSQEATLISMNQWIERTLDDSAGRRMCIPETFLSIDAVLILCANVSNGIVVYREIINKRISAELPFMATEEIIMHGVKNGGNRQELHEHIRIHSMEATRRIKLEGKENDLIERIAEDKIFNTNIKELNKILNPKNLCGRAVNQVTEYLEEYVKPVLEKNKELLENIEKNVEI